MKTVRLMGFVASMLMSVGAFADMSGKWVLTVDSPQATTNPTFEISQEGDKLTCTYTGGMGSAPCEGTVNDQEFSIDVNVDFQGQAFVITYSGKLDGDAISGEMDLGGMGGATFTGARQ